MNPIAKAVARITGRTPDHTPAKPIVVVSDGTIAPHEAERLIAPATMLCLRIDALAETREEFRSDHGWDVPGAASRSLSNLREGPATTLRRTIDRNVGIATSMSRIDRHVAPTPWSRGQALALPWAITLILEEDDLAEHVTDATTRNGIRIGDADDRGRRTIHDLALWHHARIVRDAVACLKAVADGTSITGEQARAVTTMMAADMMNHAGAKDLKGIGVRLADGHRLAALTAHSQGRLVGMHDAPANPFVAHDVVFRGIGMTNGIVRTRTPFHHIDDVDDVMALMRAAVVDAEVREHARSIGALPR